MIVVTADIIAAAEVAPKRGVLVREMPRTPILWSRAPVPIIRVEVASFWCVQSAESSVKLRL